MSGGVDRFDLEPSEAQLEIMEKFKVDKGTAKAIVAFCNTLACEKMDKWMRNFRKTYSNKAEDIYKLVKQFGKLTGNGLLEEIEKKVLEMCVDK